MRNKVNIPTNTLRKIDSILVNPKTKDLKTKDNYFDLLIGCLIIGLALLIRLCISYYPYGGANKPPMYGDYEAQRHWQEITLNLPISQWYSNSSNNDLQYWGLDYPPITAYHSFLVGYIAHLVDPKSVKLHESRGYESSMHKYFMRLSVLIVDLLIFIPAVIHFALTTLTFSKKKSNEKNKLFNPTHVLLTTILCYPGIILIDYGHFQYNCVSLGFFIASVSLLLQGSMISGSCFFVLALNYKQMELYHALPCFFYILGLCVKKQSFISCIRSLLGVSLTVVATFILIWFPFFSSIQVFIDALSRLFPLNRGIFEDKVANVWCAINVLYKLRKNLSNLQLATICLITTTCALLPSSLDLFLKPSRDKFLLAIINSSLSFFLFSFQVHEKSILLVAIPVLLQFHKDPFYCFWFLIISVFSMLPLLIKDGLFVAYFMSLIFFIVIVSWIEPQVNELIVNKESKHQQTYFQAYKYIIALFGLSLLGVIVISFLSIFFNPPEKYPDLYSLLVSVYSCGHFVIFFVYFNYKQIFLIANKKAKCE